MSADKDRGIRRQKQKRAKEMKRQAALQRKPAEPPRRAATKPADTSAA